MNIVDNEEVKEMRENINEIKQKITKANEKNKQEWIRKVNEEFNNINYNLKI